MGNSEGGNLPISYVIGDPLDKVLNILLLFVKYSIHGQDPVGSRIQHDSYIFMS